MKFLKQLTLLTILVVFSSNSFACKNANGDETTNEDECVPEPTEEGDEEEAQGSVTFSIEEKKQQAQLVNADSVEPVLNCLDNLQTSIKSSTAKTCDTQANGHLCYKGKLTPKGGLSGKPVDITVYKLDVPEVNFETIRSCKTIFGTNYSQGKLKEEDITVQHYYGIIANQASHCGPDLAKAYEATLRYNKCKEGERKTPSTPCALPQPQKLINSSEDAQNEYNDCVGKYASDPRSNQISERTVVGLQKCVAINVAEFSTETNFKAAEAMGSGPIKCEEHNGSALDYNSCKEFLTWYMGMMGAETGANLVNEAVKVNDNMKTQAQVSEQLSKGNGQNAAIEAARKAQLTAADAEKRKAMIYSTKAAAMTVELARFVTLGNIDNKCSGENKACCKSLQKDFKTAGKFFPNSKLKTLIMQEMIKAGGEAAKALLAAKMYKDQANMIKNIENNMRPQEDESQQGLMAYCVKNPQDTRCQTPGMRQSLQGMNLTGAGYGGTNFGMNDAGAANEVDLNAENGAAGAIASNKKSVGDIGTLNKDAAAAKDIFNAPAAVQGGTGAPATAGSGGGGAGVNASGNALSKDPGLQEEKKDNPINITKKTASYEGGAYSGGTYKGSSQKKAEDGSSNPFASMFGKDKGRETASTPEIDQPASDLFTKISNRYGEVQKRKALMDVR
ncbi:MAG: hypothetical protein K2P81_10770 [Bacteriovoracaceae bacterium]|nr:hypothetical protein [Bacteriovoracaceae bacterium]